ncbi:MAG: protein kinase [Spirochaetaceae bacterium]|jgi:serine/threonine protein kinase/tetratricopeptide (TPR) repeat protein|nr:protein kinase [Spirochaetaceae bacterium]
METQILNNTTAQIEEAALNDRQNQLAIPSADLLQAGEAVNGWTISEKLKTDSGEAEIYLCKKDKDIAIFKYYYNKKPKLEVMKKLKALNQPNIIELIEYGNYNNRFYEVQEYAEGGSLDSKTPDGSWVYLPLKEDDAAEVVKETIEAFKACHDAGIIHRDIKPGNLFYKTKERQGVLVGDFGISSSFDVEDGMSKHLTQSNDKTIGFAAPEVFSSVIGKEMDYYSLGVTLWMLLTGKEPFVNEKGQPLSDAQITLDTVQGKTVTHLLERSSELSTRMKTLIQGLMIVRHDKRWGYNEVSKFLAGEDVPLFNEVREFPTDIDLAGHTCSSYLEIAQALLTREDAVSQYFYQGRLVRELVKFNDKLADALSDLIDEYNDPNDKSKLIKGLVFAACKISPAVPFPIGKNSDEEEKAVSGLRDIADYIESDPVLIMPFLRDETKGLYYFLEAVGAGDNAEKILEIAKSSSGEIRGRKRILVAMNGNKIKPFEDGTNNNIVLEKIEDLDKLPDYLQTRILLFIQKKQGLISAWIENLTGRNLDLWLTKYQNQKDKLLAWGEWKYFRLFLEGKDVQKNTKFSVEKDDQKLWGLKDAFNNELLPAIWLDINEESIAGKFIVCQKDYKWQLIDSKGTGILPPEYSSMEIFNEEFGQYKVQKDGIWQIVDDNGNSIYESKEKINVYASATNPFDVITEGTRYLLSADFQVIKKADKIAVADYGKNTKPANNTVWLKDGTDCYCCDGQGNNVKSIPYTDFEIQNISVWVQVQNNKFGLAAPDGEIILDCVYDDYVYCGEINDVPYAALKKANDFVIYKFIDHGIIPRELHKIVYENGKYVLSHDNAKSIQVDYICDITEKAEHIYTSKHYANFVYKHCLYGFADNELICLDIDSLKDTPRNKLFSGEEEMFYKHIDTIALWKKVHTLKKAGNIIEMNKTVDRCWKIFATSYFNAEHQEIPADYETAKRLLWFIKPDNTEGLENEFWYYEAQKAKCCEMLKDHKNAVMFYEDAIKRNKTKDNTDHELEKAYCWLGLSYRGLNDYKNALVCFDKALEFDPEEYSNLKLKGQTLIDLNKFPEAIGHCNMVLDMHKFGGNMEQSFHSLRSEAYSKLGMKDKGGV